MSLSRIVLGLLSVGGVLVGCSGDFREFDLRYVFAVRYCAKQQACGATVGDSCVSTMRSALAEGKSPFNDQSSSTGSWNACIDAIPDLACSNDEKDARYSDNSDCKEALGASAASSLTLPRPPAQLSLLSCTIAETGGCGRDATLSTTDRANCESYTHRSACPSQWTSFQSCFNSNRACTKNVVDQAKVVSACEAQIAALQSCSG